MDKIKDVLRPYYRWYKDRYDLLLNYFVDLKNFKKYAVLFERKDLFQKETDLILNYHGLEKGMLHSEMKARFAQNRVLVLHELLKEEELNCNVKRSQIKVGYQLMCKYYEIHKEKNINIDDFFTEEQYQFYKKILGSNYNVDFEGVYSFNKSLFYNDVTKLDFSRFAYSRKSIRNYTGEKISIDRIEKVIELANTSPSVCNRQASNIYLVEDADKVNKLLQLQGGFRGFDKDVKQLLVVTNDRKYYYTVGERNQLYIDGGIYLMNLLYALHYYKIGNCPANWGKCYGDENKAISLLKISKSEKIICLIVIGEAKESFRTTLSLRRPINENFKII
ncbi:nitroreductase family protein [Myroides odoratimimus]|uniref:nitroreductase family protein n=1 Tax=Myroides odoratimimus TaxID=76832 RepID=UPI0025790165|nr:nitroreductase family protein [Myroides odoratimimus]MDM1094745.1 nitroreductase family protein [Myroides odoratimimus]